MTYKLNPVVCKITSEIILCAKDQSVPEGRYEDGAALASESFDKNLIISSISAAGDVIVLSVTENPLTNDISWAKAEEADVSFF